MSISRRRFFQAGLAVTVVGGFYGVFKWFTAKPEDIVLSILSRRLGYMQIQHDDFHKFSIEYVRRKARFRKELRKLSVLSDPLEYFSPYGLLPQTHAYRRMEDSVVSLFLLSTDFFYNDADETRTITYWGYYDPLITVCRNPIMRRV